VSRFIIFYLNMKKNKDLEQTVYWDIGSIIILFLSNIETNFIKSNIIIVEIIDLTKHYSIYL
jgi:hypothetical protein